MYIMNEGFQRAAGKRRCFTEGAIKDPQTRILASKAQDAISEMVDRIASRYRIRSSDAKSNMENCAIESFAILYGFLSELQSAVSMSMVSAAKQAGMPQIAQLDNIEMMCRRAGREIQNAMSRIDMGVYPRR